MKFVQTCIDLKQGIGKRFANQQSLTFGDQTWQIPALVALLQAVSDTADAQSTLAVQWHRSVAVAKDAASKARGVVKALIAYLRGLYGDNSAALADFGLTPRKVRKPKPAVQAAAADKNRATRKARNTMGKVERKKVKGTATGPATPAPANKQ